jgi:hypothetical protein
MPSKTDAKSDCISFLVDENGSVILQESAGHNDILAVGTYEASSFLYVTRCRTMIFIIAIISR